MGYAKIHIQSISAVSVYVLSLIKCIWLQLQPAWASLSHRGVHSIDQSIVVYYIIFEKLASVGGACNAAIRPRYLQNVGTVFGGI